VFFVAIVEGNEAELAGVQACGFPVIYETGHPGFAVATPGAQVDLDFGTVEVVRPFRRGLWEGEFRVLFGKTFGKFTVPQLRFGDWAAVVDRVFFVEVGLFGKGVD
jgi:hypothetical protein